MANQETRSSGGVLDQFKAFVIAATTIAESATARPPIVQFRTFIQRATPLAVAHLKAGLPKLRDRAALAGRWWTPHDLLTECGLSYVENAYTRLMAWALDPATHPPTAVLRQQAWLLSVGLGDLCASAACTPVTQLVTEEGIPDMVLRYAGGIVIVEAKTGTEEHETPSGVAQTVAYIASVREEWNLPAETRIEVIFISPDGVAAENPAAKVTTFAGFALALATALEGQSLPSETRAAFTTLFTHFLACASAGRSTTRRLIEQVMAWSSRDDWNDDAQVLRHMKALQTAASQLRLTEVQ